jgi:hypothetical protein
LKDHTNPLPERDDIRTRLIDILTVESNRSFNPNVRDELVQAVKGSKKGRFTASGRPDQGSDLALLDIDVNILEGLDRTVIEIKLFCFHLYDGAGFCHGRTFSELKIIQFCLKLTNYDALIK